MRFKRNVPLPMPAECAGAKPKPQNKQDDPDKMAAEVQCHESLICQRCQNCFLHCDCGPAQRAPAERPRRRAGEVDEAQMELCPKPELRYTKAL